MIHSKRGLIVIGILTLILGLIIKMPARVVIHRLAPPDVAIGGIQGTLWSGSAGEASVAGIYVRDVKWDLAPLQLLTGALSYQVSATPVSGFVETDLSIGFSGAVSLTDLRASLPLELFAGVIGVRGLQGSGSFQFESLEIVDGMVVVADGTLQIADLIVPMVGRDSLGGYKVDFFTQDDGISASIEDSDGVLDLAGSLEVKADRSFALLAEVIVTPQTPEGARRQLRMLPPANERGQQELRLEGIL